jgi:hypothetical protein
MGQQGDTLPIDDRVPLSGFWLLVHAMCEVTKVMGLSHLMYAVSQCAA